MLISLQQARLHAYATRLTTVVLMQANVSLVTLNVLNVQDLAIPHVRNV